MPTSVTINDPFLSVCLKNVVITDVADGNIGKDVNISLTVNHGPKVTFGEHSDPKSIYQAKDQPLSSGGSYTRDVEYEFLEKDPVHPDTASNTTSITISLNSPVMPASGTHTITIPVTAYEGPFYGTRSATFLVNLSWYLTADIRDAIIYIGEEMAANKNSADVAVMKILNKLSDLSDPVICFMSHVSEFMKPEFLLACKALAWALWSFKVAPGEDWDHKPAIRPTLGDFALDADRGARYRFDIWSNIHYGYIGRVAGFSEPELLRGAAVAQSISDLLHSLKSTIVSIADGLTHVQSQNAAEALKQLAGNNNLRNLLRETMGLVSGGEDEPVDRFAIRIGFRLFDTYGDGFTNSQAQQADLLKEVRDQFWGDTNARTDAPEGRSDRYP